MRKFTLLLFSVTTLISTAQNKITNPPGTVKVADNLFLDIAEISNAAWAEYRNWLKNKYGENSAEYLASALDTNVWRDKLFYNEPYVKYYHSHPAYKDYPVVGVSYEQAVAYCNWRSDRVNELYYFKKHKLKYHADSNYVVEQIVKYRLPNKAEWEKFAAVDFDEKTKTKANKKQHVLYNYFKQDTLNNANSVDVTAPVLSYYPDKNGVYNLLGNVAEMVNEKGIAKGGSFIHTLDELTPQKDFAYEKPSCYIGFRCAAELVK
jgi:formylglycine-generating enzyme required for sulfatase activity